MVSLLIIDDEPIIRKLLSRMMELEGYEVFQAESCATGIKQLKMHCPQVVLCDVILPDGNGVDLIPEMKRQLPDSEVIMRRKGKCMTMVDNDEAIIAGNKLVMACLTATNLSISGFSSCSR